MFLLLETPILDISAISVTSVGICTLEHRVQFSAKKPISVSFLERHLAITLSHAYGFVSYLHRGPKIIGINFFASSSRAFGIFLNNDCFSSHRCEDYIKCRWICAIYSPISILERFFFRRAWFSPNCTKRQRDNIGVCHSTLHVRNRSSFIESNLVQISPKY